MAESDDDDNGYSPVKPVGTVVTEGSGGDNNNYCQTKSNAHADELMEQQPDFDTAAVTSVAGSVPQNDATCAQPDSHPLIWSVNIRKLQFDICFFQYADVYGI